MMLNIMIILSNRKKTSLQQTVFAKRKRHGAEWRTGIIHLLTFNTAMMHFALFIFMQFFFEVKALKIKMNANFILT